MLNPTELRKWISCGLTITPKATRQLLNIAEAAKRCQLDVEEQLSFENADYDLSQKWPANRKRLRELLEDVEVAHASDK